MKKWLSNLFFALLINLFFYAFTNAQFNSPEEKFHNKIDDVTTSAQIETFLKSLNPQFSTFHINNSLNFPDDACKHVSDSLHCVPWFKADFDNNGYTDLVVVGGWDDHVIFCILDSGNNRYAVNRLTRKIFQNCTFPLLEKINDNNLLLYCSLNEVKRDSIKVDTLIYKFGDFVDYHSAWKNNNIEEIEFTAHECFGQCPQFELIIDSNRSATYNAVKYNKRSGEFEGTIDEDNFTQLIQLLNYIDFPHLENNYAVNWKDDKNCTLRITYDKGKIKTIYDDGMHGSFGLERVYQILYELRDDQRWQKILPGEKRIERTSE